jgi:hypothetical protein
MVFSPKFESALLQKVADDCGLVIDGNNPEATSKEIEFFVERFFETMTRGLQGPKVSK